MYPNRSSNEKVSAIIFQAEKRRKRKGTHGPCIGWELRGRPAWGLKLLLRNVYLHRIIKERLTLPPKVPEIPFDGTILGTSGVGKST